MVKLLGPDGRPLETKDLTGEIAAPQQFGARALDLSSVASGLTPERLAALLRAANHGHAREYLTLAAEMEERYLHYGAQLQTRRLALDGVTISVSAPDGCDARAVDLVKSVVDEPNFSELVLYLQDGVGKSYAVVEPVWDYAHGAMRPVDYKFRDPRFFRYDEISMSDLCLVNEAGMPGRKVESGYFVKHEPKIRLGLQIRAGVARSAAWAFLLQSFSLQDWAAFCEIYGIPLRLGKYGEGATAENKRVLLNAVRSISNDAAAVVPKSMEIEFIETTGTRGEQVFGNLIDYLDRKVSMLVLGQTMTAESGSSLAQAKIHNEVRHDILRADAKQTAKTINRDLIRPLVSMNFGPQEVYPIVQLETSEPEDLKAFGDFLAAVAPLGLKVSQKYVRDKASIPDPGEGEELLNAAPPPSKSPAPLSALAARACSCPSCAPQTARLAASVQADDPAISETDALTTDALGDWQEISDPLLRGLLTAVNGASSFEDALSRLDQAKIDSGPLTERLAKACALSRGLGLSESGDAQ